jgi:hypothetical protein
MGKQLRSKAHTVIQVEETDDCMLVRPDRLGKRLLRCGFADNDAQRFTIFQKSGVVRSPPAEVAIETALPSVPSGVSRCGVRVEDFPWAEHE